MTEGLDRIVDQELAEVRRRLIHRYVDVATVDVKNDRAGSLIRNRILLNERFIRRFPAAVEPRVVVRMLIARMMNRRIRVPKDLYESARMYLAVRSAVYAERAAQRILQSLLHIINDDDLWSRGFAEELKAVYAASAKHANLSTQDAYWRVLAATLERRWTVSLGVDWKLSPVHMGLVSRLAALSYERRDLRYDVASRFATLVSTMFRFQRTANGGAGSGARASGNTGEPEVPSVWPLAEDGGGSDLAGLTGIEAGVSALLSESNEPGLAEMLLEAFSLQAGVTDLPQQAHPGKGRWWWYRHLARKYEIPVAPRESTLAERAYPVELRPWSITDPVEAYDPVASYGLPLPPIARRRLYTGGESDYSEERVPDLVLCLDSSGSMVNPDQQKSHAVLAACVAARSYLGNAGRVAVVNFSSSSSVLNFCEDEASVLQSICRYQGGGTTMSMEVLDALLTCRHRTARAIDLLVISDMGIGNLNDVVATIAGYEQTHRVFLFHVQCTPEAFAQTQARFACFPHVETYRIDRQQEDLPKIVLGRVSSSILGRSAAFAQSSGAEKNRARDHKDGMIGGEEP
jgi:hypothetical protein